MCVQYLIIHKICRNAYNVSQFTRKEPCFPTLKCWQLWNDLAVLWVDLLVCHAAGTSRGVPSLVHWCRLAGTDYEGGWHRRPNHREVYVSWTTTSPTPQTHTYTHACAYVYIYMHIYIHTYIYTYMCVYICVCVYIYTLIHSDRISKICPLSTVWFSLNIQ